MIDFVFVSSLENNREADDEYQNYYFGALMGIIASVSRAFVFVSTRKLCQNKTSSSPILLTFHMSVTSLLFNLSWGLVIGDSGIFSGSLFSLSGRVWLVYLSVAVLGATNLGLCNIALKLANPVLVSFIRSSDIIVAYLIQVIIFHEAANILGIMGSVCILIAIAILQFVSMFNKLLSDSVKFLF